MVKKFFFSKKKVLKGSASLSDLPLLIELCCKVFYFIFEAKKIVGGDCCRILSLPNLT